MPELAAVTSRGVHPVPEAVSTLLDQQLTSGVRAASIWDPSFPRTDLLDAAASLVPAVREAAGPTSVMAEGPRWEVVIAPGAVQVRTKDWARHDRTEQRNGERDRKTADQLGAWTIAEGEFPADPDPTRVITGWSRKSRARMVHRLCELDYAPLFGDPSRLPAMITLTYPGAWEVVAPTGRAAKRHLQALRKRYLRAWGEPLACVWKLEFQRRGAPHFHLLMVPPHGTSGGGMAFREWLSVTWANIVNHPDPEEYRRHLLAGTGVDWSEGLRARDPKRVAIYFTKHGSFRAKEYQHCVPELWQTPETGPGRFWGYWELKPARSAVRVLPRIGIQIGRTLRRWARAQGTTRQVTVERVEQATGRVRYRTSRVRVRRLAANRGWVSVNDGASFGAAIGRYVSSLAPDLA